MKGRKGNNPTKGVSVSNPSPSMVYAGGGSNVIKEAKQRKRGGKVVGMEGKMASMRLDRPGRKRGGRVGADTSPLTHAASVSAASGHSTDSG